MSSCRLFAAGCLVALTALTVGSSALGAGETAAPPAAVAAASQAAVPSAANEAAAPSQAGAAAAPSAANAPAPAGETAAPPAAIEATQLDERIQKAKSDVIQLNRDLMVLEEELLFPANTQVAVFVSLDVGKLFALDSVQVKLDDKEVANYLYTPTEVAALHRGGVQRIYLGNVRAGAHALVAFFTGKGPHDRDYRRGATVKFDKGTDPKYIELQIKDSSGKIQPEFEVKIWQ